MYAISPIIKVQLPISNSCLMYKFDLVTKEITLVLCDLCGSFSCYISESLSSECIDFDDLLDILY